MANSNYEADREHWKQSAENFQRLADSCNDPETKTRMLKQVANSRRRALEVSVLQTRTLSQLLNIRRLKPRQVGGGNSVVE